MKQYSPMLNSSNERDTASNRQFDLNEVPSAFGLVGLRDIRQGYQLSEGPACGLIGIMRWINRYRSRREPQKELRMRIRDLAGSRVRYGYRD